MSATATNLVKPFILVVASIVTVVGCSAYFLGSARLDERHEIRPTDISASVDDSTLARGRHLSEAITLCLACHGDDLGGQALVDEPAIMTLYAPNLTKGRGGTGSSYTDADYVRAIRHGVNREGRGLLIMHSDAYHHLSRSDLGAIVAYVKSAPAVDREVPPVELSALGKAMVGLGLMDGPVPLVPAERIDHERAISERSPPAGSPEHGQYLVSVAMCEMCHGADLTGGPAIEEGAPPGPNIAIYGRRDPSGFIDTIRTGTTPFGTALDRKHMPWEIYAKMTDGELRDIWSYLSSLGR